jgi:hypothetical protein
MHTRAIPLILLTLVLAGCSDDLPTAPPDHSRAMAARANPDRADLPFLGRLERASHTDAFDPGTGTALIHLEGTGTATHLGRFTMEVDYALNPATLSGPESMKLVAANGDALFASGRAQGAPSEDGQSLTSREELTITGGTGRFAGVTGSFILSQIDLAPDRFSSGSIVGTIGLGR